MENFNYAFISNKNNIENMVDNYKCENKDKVLLNVKLKLKN